MHYLGTVAAEQGTHRPQLASSAVTNTLRISVLFPLMLGAVRRYNPRKCTGFNAQVTRSIQLGDSPCTSNAAVVAVAIDEVFVEIFV